MEEITSRKNPLIIHMKRLAADRGARREAGEFFCQGDKLYAEALKWGAEITAVLFCGDAPEIPEGVRAARVPADIIESVSPMKSAPEIVFSCRFPALRARVGEGKLLAIENMQDPGNVGTILRTANAMGCRGVVLAGDCADPFGPKAVRASMGAVFRQNIAEMTTAELINAAKAASAPIFAAALDKTAADIREIQFPDGLIFAVGNEGKGLSAELLAASRKRVIIPMNEQCESLNAGGAAAIILWEMFRRG